MTQCVEVVRLRPEDEAECRAGGFTPQEAVDRSVEQSVEAFAYRATDGTLLAYWGHAPTGVLTGTCWAWMLSCPGADAHPIQLARASLVAVDKLLSTYHTVQVLVDVEYNKAVHWLEWLGFMPLGPSANPRFMVMAASRKRTVN